MKVLIKKEELTYLDEIDFEEKVVLLREPGNYFGLVIPDKFYDENETKSYRLITLDKDFLQGDCYDISHNEIGSEDQVKNFIKKYKSFCEVHVFDYFRDAMKFYVEETE